MATRGRYPAGERYEEIDREVYRDSHGRRTTRTYDEIDEVTSSRGGVRERELEFLREDYGRRGDAGQVVIRDRPRRARSVEREDITIRRSDRDRYRREVEREELDVTIRKEDDRRRQREIEREEVHVRRSETDLALRPREISRDREDILIRRGGGKRPVREEKEEITIRHDERHGRGRDLVDERESINVRTRSRSRPRHDSMPPRGLGYPIGRETEEVVIRRGHPHHHPHSRRSSSSRSRSRSPRRRVEKEEIIIRQTKERTPSPPTPEPEPVMMPPIIRPPIHQEIITHHRHIDHGIERARSLSPRPRSPSPRKVEDTVEVDIKRRGRRGSFEEEKVIIDHRSRSRHPSRERGGALIRPRSLSTRRRKDYYDEEIADEADYYNRRAMERARIGEAHNGATRDWAILDVPPGTERVRMDGAGGGSQEITWQRYNGVRRSKFVVGGREYDTPFGNEGIPRPPVAGSSSTSVSVNVSSSRTKKQPQLQSDMWTEITKDLVVKEAIETMGFQYEETEFFFYVTEYLRYEDVLQLVEITEDIRRERRRRLREIEWEREELRQNRRHYDDKYYEREVILDRRRH